VYTPRTAIRAQSDVNLFLTRHRLLHTYVPRVPISVAYCWINVEFERQKLTQKDFGYIEIGEAFLAK
jgi:hypothetical protein